MKYFRPQLSGLIVVGSGIALLLCVLSGQSSLLAQESGSAGKDDSGAEPAAPKADNGEEASEEEEYVAPPPPPPRKPRIPIQELQYRVEIPLVFERSIHMGPAFKAEVVDELRTLSDRSFGAIWDFVIYDPTWLTPRNSAGIAAVDADAIKSRNQILSTAEALAELITQQTEDEIEIEVSNPLPAELAKAVGELIAIPNEVELDEQRKTLLRALVAQISPTKIDEEKTALIAELMTLYILPTPQRIDKVFPIAVEQDGSFYQVSGREWDRDSETLSPAASRRTLDRRGIAEEIIGLLGDLYHPVGQIDQADADVARVKMRGGYFAAGNKAFSHVTKETLFKPFFRYLDEDRVLRQLQDLPWSYLSVDDVKRERIECTVTTGVGTPLGAFRRRRMEIRAIALNPRFRTTTLRLAPKRNHEKPLVGYLVAVYDEPPPPPPPKGEEPSEDAPPPPKPDIYRSDRFGTVTIPVDPQKSLEWVFIRSGSALLTKFPIVPGAEKEMLAECPDDTIRLDVEGQLVLLQSRLVDTIAKRSVVMAMITNRGKKGEWDKVDESLKELDSLPTLEEFTAQVETIQFLPKERAKARNDRRTVSRITRLGKEVLKVAAIHLDQEKLDEFKEATREMRELDKNGGNARERRPVGN